MGFLTWDAAARIKHERSLLRTNEARQRDGQTEAGMKPEAGEVGAISSFGTGNAKVSDKRQAKATSDSRSLYGCNNRLARSEQSNPILVEIAGFGVALSARGGGICAAREICPPSHRRPCYWGAIVATMPRR